MSFNNLNSFYSDNAVLYFECSNQIDSAFEFVTEQVLGWDNFVPENKHHPHHQMNHFHKAGHHCWYLESKIDQDIAINSLTSTLPFRNFTSIAIGFTGDINPPPPKA